MLEPALFEHHYDAAAHVSSPYSQLHRRISIHAIERNGERHGSDAGLRAA